MKEKELHFAYIDTGMYTAKAAKNFLEAYRLFEEAMNNLNDLEDYFAMMCAEELIPFSLYDKSEFPNTDQIGNQILIFAEICSEVAIEATKHYDPQFSLFEAEQIVGYPRIRRIERNL